MKGKITSEELKSQLSEHLPGAMQIFAEAIGKTVPEMLEIMDKDQLLSKDVLPKVGKAMANAARKGGALGAQLKGLRVEEGRFKTEWLLLKEAMGQTGFAQMALSTLKTLTTLIRNETPTLKIFASTLNLAFQTVLLPIKLVTGFVRDLNNLLPDTANNFQRMSVSILGTAAALWAMVAAFKAIKFIWDIRTGGKGRGGKVLGDALGGGRKGGAAEAIQRFPGAMNTIKKIAYGGLAATAASSFLPEASKSPSDMVSNFGFSGPIQFPTHVKHDVNIKLKSDMLEAEVHKVFSDSLNQNSQE